LRAVTGAAPPGDGTGDGLGDTIGSGTV